MRKPRSFRELWDRLYQEEEGAVSLETVLIIGAIAMPILIFLLKYGFPKIKQYFYQSLNNLQGSSNDVINTQ